MPLTLRAHFAVPSPGPPIQYPTCGIALKQRERGEREQKRKKTGLRPDGNRSDLRNGATTARSARAEAQARPARSARRLWTQSSKRPALRFEVCGRFRRFGRFFVCVCVCCGLTLFMCSSVLFFLFLFDGFLCFFCCMCFMSCLCVYLCLIGWVNGSWVAEATFGDASLACDMPGPSVSVS